MRCHFTAWLAESRGNTEAQCPPRAPMYDNGALAFSQDDQEASAVVPPSGLLVVQGNTPTPLKYMTSGSGTTLGVGVSRDYQEAVKWYRFAAAW